MKICKIYIVNAHFPSGTLTQTQFSYLYSYRIRKKLIFRYGFGETNNLGSVSKKKVGNKFLGGSEVNLDRRLLKCMVCV